MKTFYIVINSNLEKIAMYKTKAEALAFVRYMLKHHDEPLNYFLYTETVETVERP